MLVELGADGVELTARQVDPFHTFDDIVVIVTPEPATGLAVALGLLALANQRCQHGRLGH